MIFLDAYLFFSERERNGVDFDGNGSEEDLENLE